MNAYPEYASVHNLMRHLGLRPYAIFPGPAWDVLAVYIHPPAQPACLLIQKTWSSEWLQEWHARWMKERDEPESSPSVREDPSAALRLRSELALRATKGQGSGQAPSQKAASLQQEVQALAERLGCPAAGVILVLGYIRSLGSWRSFTEEVQRQGVVVAFAHSERQPGQLNWVQPSTRMEQPTLPPYPARTRWHIPVESSWWLTRLNALANLDDKERKREARYLADQALTYLKEAPARLLIEGPTVLQAASETLKHLSAHLNRPAGRSYLFWVGFYSSGVNLAGVNAGQTSSEVTAFFNHLLAHWEEWSTRERRLVLRGLEMLTGKSVEFVLPRDDPFCQFLASLFPRLLSDFQPEREWRFQSHLKDLAMTLAAWGYVPTASWLDWWKQHKRQGEVLIEAHKGLIERLVREPSADLWWSVWWADLKRERHFAFRWHLYADDFAPAFWDLAAQEPALLNVLIEAALAILKDAHLPPAPEALQNLLRTVQQKLQDPSTPTWLRNQLEAARSQLSGN